MPHTTLIRLPEVLRRVGLGRSSVYRLISEHRFPTPIKIGPRASAWVEGEIDVWVEACIAASRQPTAHRRSRV